MADTGEIDYMTAKGWLKDGERKLLFEHASRLRGRGNAVILNIGVEYGASLACLRAGNAAARIIGLDLDISKAVSDYGCELYQVDSHEAVKTWEQPLDLIFVDGDHGKEGVLMDAKFADFLAVGRYILFQDCWDWDQPNTVHQVCPGVNAAVDEWFAVAAHQEEFEELPSVDTTRVFKRIRRASARAGASAGELEEKNGINGSNGNGNEKPGVAHRSGVDTNLQPGGTPEPQSGHARSEPEVRGRSKNTGKRR